MVQAALIDRDEEFVLNLIKKQAQKLSSSDYIDLNVGPAKNTLEGILPWLCDLVETNTDLKISFDSTNSDEIKRGLEKSKNPQNCLINSTSADEVRLEKATNLASEFGSGLIALTMNKELGIPKFADDRLNLAFEIYEKYTEKGLENEKIFFDPLILPVSVDQSQAQEALNTIMMIKESFDPPVMTTVGLSNISNGSPNEMRPLINRVFATLAHGAGLDSAIIDSFDSELICTLKVLETQKSSNKVEELYIDLSSMIKDFGQLEDINYDKSDPEQVKIIKTARVLLNKEVYTHSYAQI